MDDNSPMAAGFRGSLCGFSLDQCAKKHGGCLGYFKWWMKSYTVIWGFFPETHEISIRIKQPAFNVRGSSDELGTKGGSILDIRKPTIFEMDGHGENTTHSSCT